MGAVRMTMDFSFYLPTRVAFGYGKSRSIAEEVKKLNGKKVLFLADKGVINAGLAEPLIKCIEDQGISVHLFDRIVANPRDTDCQDGAEYAKEMEIDTLVALGGGSTIDTAKAIATLMSHGGRIGDWCGADKLLYEVVPLIAIPTTAGTGSEVTPFSVITDTKHHEKLNIFDQRIAPKVAIVDPSLLETLPKHIVAATGIDALTHAVEAYTCKLATPFTDAYALYAMNLIYNNLEGLYKGYTEEKSEQVMLGSVIAGMAFGYSDVGAVHCMAEAMGGLYDMPHGVANAICLPSVLSFNKSSNIKKHGQIAKAFGLETKGFSDEICGDMAISAIKDLCEKVKIPALSSFEMVSPNDFRKLSKVALNNVSNDSNSRLMSETDYLSLFHDLYKNQ